MKQTTKTVQEIIDTKGYCPIPLKVIPNQMGINLCSVNSISWQKQDDGQLVSLTINFIPNNFQNITLREQFEKEMNNPGTVYGMPDYIKWLENKLDNIQAENEQLKDFCIWLTGCGYDFCKHDYFIEMRDKLLKPRSE